MRGNVCCPTFLVEMILWGLATSLLIAPCCTNVWWVIIYRCLPAVSENLSQNEDLENNFVNNHTDQN